MCGKLPIRQFRGRNDEGPSFIEAHTYRQRGHVEFEYTFLSRTYRDQSEVELWKTNDKDPILRLESYFIEHSKYSGDDIEKIQKEVQDEVDDAVKFAIESPEPEISSAMDHMIER